MIDAECVACNPCVITCSVEDCITMESLPVGALDPRTGKVVEVYANWTTHPNNPELGRRGRGCEVDRRSRRVDTLQRRRVR